MIALGGVRRQECLPLLPFLCYQADTAALAVACTPARQKDMCGAIKNGFTFKLTPTARQRNSPHISTLHATAEVDMQLERQTARVEANVIIRSVTLTAVLFGGDSSHVGDFAQVRRIPLTLLCSILFFTLVLYRKSSRYSITGTGV